MSFVICLFLWCLVVVVMTMRFECRIHFSTAERRRRSAQGDAMAVTEQDRLERQPLYGGFLYGVRTVTVVVFVVVCIQFFGIIVGSIGAMIGLLAVPLAYRLPFFQTVVDDLVTRAMPVVRTITDTLQPLLIWLRDREMTPVEPVLHSREELLEVLARSPDVLTIDEQQHLVAGLAFEEGVVKDIMTPKKMIHAIPTDEVLGPLVLDHLYKTGHNHFPVYEQTIDRVVGMLDLHDVVDMKTRSRTAGKAMRTDVFYIHQDDSLLHALHLFVTTHQHICMVVASHGIVGIVSLKDVVEALLGATIVDTFDVSDTPSSAAEYTRTRTGNTFKRKEDT